MPGKLIDLTGCVFGRLTVTGRANAQGKPRWICTCSCGGQTTTTGPNLKRGMARSCGCLREEMRRRPKWSEPVSANRSEYNSWTNARRRCEDPDDRYFHLYGGRGIEMCEAWRNDFSAFLRDMGRKPGPSYSIDRIDNDKGYEPGNCRWATAAEQTKNRRVTRWVVLFGETMTLTEACQKFGLSTSRVRQRLRSGCSDEEAFSRA